MYQNRAAALERLGRLEEGLKDCGESLRLNNRYGESYDRRSKILKKLVDTLDGGKLEERIKHLRQALEDVSVLAQLDGYNPQQLVIVDEVLKQLGSSLAIVTARTRQPVIPSNYTILQYFASFIEDPLFENVSGESKYASAKTCFEKKEFSRIIPLCDEEISSQGPDQLKAKLLKATFLVLTKQLPQALQLLSDVIGEAKEDTEKKIIVNALVKRGSLYIQQCQDPQNDAKLSFADFNRAADLDPSNADVFFNRGQINLLMDKYPDCIESYALLAKVYQESGKLQEADELYKKGHEKNPENANLIVYRALLYLQQTGDVSKALEDMNKAVVMDDKCEFAYETIGQIGIQKGNLEGARDAFKKAIPLVNTELEMAHLFGLSESANAKIVAKKKLQEIPTGMEDLTLD